MSTDIYEHLAELPYRRYVDVQRNRVNELNRKLNSGAYLDQHPGKVIPWAFSKLYTFGMIKAGIGTSATGFDALATLTNPAVPILPRNTNILTTREAAFYWCSTNVAGFVSWTYTSDPAYAGLPTPINATPVGDIFDSVFSNNGGAQVLNNFANPPVASAYKPPKICFDIELYDRKRGRSITDGRVPAEIFLGGGYEFKNVGAGVPVRFDVDTEIEPRVYINECRMSSPALDTNTPFNASSVQCYLNIVWKGYYALDQKRVEQP